MKKKTAFKGRRYSAKEREDAVNWIHNYNAKHMRGGLTAASKQLGISQVTLRSWLTSEMPDDYTSEDAALFQQLAKYAENIQRLRKQLDEMEQEYADLKKRIF